MIQIRDILKDKCNVVMGENGVGKTTFLDKIYGIDKNYNKYLSGSAVYLNQSLFFFEKLKVREFFSFITILGENYDEKYIQAYIDEKMMKKTIGILSGGERKFVYFLSIMSLIKDWYLLDEPFAGIDEVNGRIMVDIINQKLKENKGLIMVSHETPLLELIENKNIIKI